jgi:exopolyphosphatase/guanosine-5'-triphosphate,3'-diphosphate pyrophosphatase
MRLDDLRHTVNTLAQMTLEQRRRTPGLEPKRADVIVAGGLVALALLERMRVTSLRVSDRGVRWGLALALANRP